MALRVGGGASGELRGRYTFYSVPEVAGALGLKRGDPVAQFTVSGKLVNLGGGETVLAARLESHQPAILSIRQTTRTRQITTDWQVKDKAGVSYNIRTISDPDQKRTWFELLIESGVAA